MGIVDSCYESCSKEGQLTRPAQLSVWLVGFLSLADKEVTSLWVWKVLQCQVIVEATTEGVRRPGRRLEAFIGSVYVFEATLK